MRQRLRSEGGDDDGIAIVAAVAVVMIVSMLVLTVVSLAIFEARASGRDRARSVAVGSAEARVDSLVATVQSTAPGDLPCGTLTDSVDLASDDLDRTTVVTYYGANGAAVDCSALEATRLVQAAIKTTADTGPIVGTAPASRTVETLIRLSPEFGNDLDKAIFGNAGIELSNHASIYGQNGQPDADVYTNGNVVCDNNQHYYGSIYAQGTISLSNTCTVEVDAHAKLGITATNPGVQINGRALVSNGNISLGPASVGQQARASGTVTGNICTTTGKCVGGQSVPPPAVSTFPEMNRSGYTQWLTQDPPTENYQVVTFSGDTDPVFRCGMYGEPGPLNGKVDYVAKWIFEHGSSLTSNTVILADCPGQPVKLQGTGISINKHLVIYSQGGVNFSGNSQIVSSDGAQHRLYLIQPYDADVAPGTFGNCGDGIALDNQVTVQNKIDVLLYSPCDIRKANNTEHYGQIYAGGVAKIDNQLTMYYKPLPVWGVTAVTTAVEYYNVEIQYKRENR